MEPTSPTPTKNNQETWELLDGGGAAMCRAGVPVEIKILQSGAGPFALERAEAKYGVWLEWDGNWRANGTVLTRMVRSSPTQPSHWIVLSERGIETRHAVLIEEKPPQIAWTHGEWDSPSFQDGGKTWRWKRSGWYRHNFPEVVVTMVVPIKLPP